VAEVAAEDGKIAMIGADLQASGAWTIDASECYVIPGGVDAHTHLDTPGFGSVTADDFESGTRAAACGGTTTIVDFCQQECGQSLADALAVWHEKAAHHGVGSAALPEVRIEDNPPRRAPRDRADGGAGAGSDDKKLLQWQDGMFGEGGCGSPLWTLFPPSVCPRT
jgi:dihydroorotase-like cyclic amidohydrolase